MKKRSRLEEVLFTDTVGLSMQRNSFLYQLSEKIMRDLITGGIPLNLVKFYHLILARAKLPAPEGPKVLNIEDLRYGFTIWLIACGIAVFTFFAELLIVKILLKFKNLIKREFLNLVGLFLFWKLLRNYLRTRHG